MATIHTTVPRNLLTLTQFASIDDHILELYLSLRLNLHLETMDVLLQCLLLSL